MFTEQTYDTGIITINYVEVGASDRPVVLLHGGSARWQSSLPIIPELSQRWHIFAPDLRGHGKSGRVSGRYQLKEYVGDIAAFLEHVVKEPAVLFGHSLGGQIAIMVAAWYPHLLNGLIIGDVPFDLAKLRAGLKRGEERLLYWREFAGTDHSFEEIVTAVKNTPVAVEGSPEPVLARELFGEESSWFQEMAENLRLNDPEMLTAVIEFESMHKDYNCEQLFPLITCPVLIIQGNPALGGILTDEDIERAVTILHPPVSIARMETVGHPLHTQEKEPVLLAITSFLDTL